MKKISIFFISLLLSTLYAPVVSATACEDISYKSNSFIYDESEFSEVKKAILENTELSKNKIVSDQLKDKISEQFINPYKLYTITDPEFLSELNDSASFSELIGNTYSWIIPTKDNNIIKVKNNNDKWEVLGYSTPTDLTTSESDIIQFDKIDTKITTSAKNKSNPLEKAVCFEIPYYHTNFIYLSESNNHYLIPYSSRPDLTGLQNGKIYRITEVSKILNSTFPVGTDNDKNGGGIANQIENESNKTWTYITISCSVILLISLSLTAFYFSRKRRKR